MSRLPTIYNLSFSENTGDRYSSPSLYFHWISESEVKSPSEWTPGPSIFGGGGILYGDIEPFIVKALESGEKTAIWGAGINRHGESSQVFPDFLKSCSMVGLRDPTSPFEYVPCPSCMAYEFDSRFESPRFKVAIYEHHDHPIPTALGIPQLSNAGHPLRTVLRFLANAETIVTNSYHGVYWSLLLRRKVLIFEPFSNRFLDFPEVPTCTRENMDEALRQVAEKPASSLDLLEHRKISEEWSERLRRYFQC